MQLTGGEAVVRTLEAQGVDTVFGMPGVHNLAIYDALRDSGIRHIVARHEQGAAFMADGYARATGRVGVCLCTSGIWQQRYPAPDSPSSGINARTYAALDRE